MVRVRPSAVWGAAVLLVLVLAVVGVRSAWAQRAAAPTPIPASSAAGQDPVSETNPAPQGEVASGELSNGSGVTEAETATEGESQPPAVVYVHVIGAVSEPGVVEVSPGSRVSDVVESAGGLSKAADLSRINLARLVLDGERIWVPVLGEEPPEEVAEPIAPSASATSDGAQTGAGETDPAGTAGEPTSGVLDVNTADSTALQTLPGVGPVTAESILAWRTEHGRFATVEELMEVSGIGPRTLDKLKPLVVVGP